MVEEERGGEKRVKPSLQRVLECFSLKAAVLLPGLHMRPDKVSCLCGIPVVNDVCGWQVVYVRNMSDVAFRCDMMLLKYFRHMP